MSEGIRIMAKNEIHKTAVVHPRARLGEGVSVGPFSVIGPEVITGENVRIGSHCVIEGKTTIGKDTRIFTGAVVGSIPQDKKHKESDDVALLIGEGNVIREYVTINPGTVEGGGQTVIGDNNLFMAYSHIAHDCSIGNNCVMANNATLAGHVTVEENAVLGGLTAVHQFVRLGRLSIVGGCSKVVQDIPPFSMCDGHPARVYSLNIIGLRRAKITSPAVESLKKALKILFHSGLTKTNAIAKVCEDVETCPELEYLIDFVKTTKRGLCG
jgi:UDP-N-acetylglucosamine acyltransferase